MGPLNGPKFLFVKIGHHIYGVAKGNIHQTMCWYRHTIFGDLNGFSV